MVVDGAFGAAGRPTSKSPTEGVNHANGVDASEVSIPHSIDGEGPKGRAVVKVLYQLATSNFLTTG